jgi:transposase
MSDLSVLTDAQMERLRPFLPKRHGRPRVDDRQVLERDDLHQSQLVAPA